MNTNGTYYDLLDVDVDASEEEVQSAYRDLVRETHPDVSDDPNAREQMVELTKARDILTDEQKRAEYDAEQNIGGTDTRRRVHETAETESASSQSQYHDTGRSESRRTQQSNRGSTSSDGGQTAGSGTYSTAREQTRSKRERNRRARTQSGTHTRTGTRSRTSQTTSGSGSIGTTSPRLYLKYLYGQRGRLLRDGCAEALFILLNFCTLGIFTYWSWERVRSYLTSSTVLRLAVAFGLWWVVDWGLHQLDASTVFGEGGVLLVGLCLFVSYLGHDLLKEYTDLIGDPLSKQFDSVRNNRFWMVIGANLLALGLFFWGRSSVPLGGTGFAFFTVMTFLAFTLIFGVGITAVLFAIGANVSETVLAKSFILGPLAGLLMSFITLFTPFTLTETIDDSIADLSTSLSVPISAHPWISAQLVGQVGPVDVGVFINALIAGLMAGSWFWSLVTAFRLLTKVPWSDRFERGYRIRPGFWNFLVVLPFVLFGWMLLYGIGYVSVPIGSVTISFTVDGLFFLFGILPIIFVGSYMIRRQLEPRVRNILESFQFS